MQRTFLKRHPPVGARPGTLVVPTSGPPMAIFLIEYDGEHVTEAAVTDIEALRRVLDSKGVAWVDVRGVSEEAKLRALAAIFAIHPLALEDVVNSPQRPKFEDYPGDQSLWIARMAQLAENVLHVEQLGLIVGKNYVVSFETTGSDALDPVRQRVRDGKGPIRTAGAGYLAYAILDTVIDAYYPVIEQLSERLERLETDVVERPREGMIRELNLIKTQLVILRRGVWPQQEALTRLLRGDSQLVSPEVQLYLRDTLDHCTQLVDVIDSQRELVNSLLNTYLSLLANRTNEVMKLLTIMASIFIPLTFIAGFYGMNFTSMPEINTWWAYPAVIVVMGIVAATMVVYFVRRGWLGRGARRDDDR